jgi:hypothetical protein
MTISLYFLFGLIAIVGWFNLQFYFLAKRISSTRADIDELHDSVVLDYHRNSREQTRRHAQNMAELRKLSVALDEANKSLLFC